MNNAITLRFCVVPHNSSMDQSPIESVISVFGGVQSMAEVLGCHRSTISRWKKSGVISAKYIRKIIRHAALLGHIVDPLDII